jgi:hypothetical protein
MEIKKKVPKSRETIPLIWTGAENAYRGKKIHRDRRCHSAVVLAMSFDRQFHHAV